MIVDLMLCSEREERLRKNRAAAKEQYQRNKSAAAAPKTSTANTHEPIDLASTFMVCTFLLLPYIQIKL